MTVLNSLPNNYSPQNMILSKFHPHSMLIVYLFNNSLILSSHVLSFQCVRLPKCCQPNYFASIRAVCPTHRNVIHFAIQTILAEIYRQLFPRNYFLTYLLTYLLTYFAPVRSEYFTVHFIFRHW